jgi:hypothetical protein
MRVITVCGSLRYIKEMMEISEKMEFEGNCILVPIYNFTRKSKDEYSEEELEMLVKMQKERIKMSDAILVVDVNGYIGESTSREIEYAKLLDKSIIFYSDIIKDE